MNVLMFSMDRTLVGDKNAQGDTVERHREYGEHVDNLYIVVKSGPGYEHQTLSKNVEAYATNTKGHLALYKSCYGFAESFLSHYGLDLVVAQGLMAPIGLKVARKLGLPFIATIHAGSLKNPDWSKNIFRKIFLAPTMKRVLKKADGVRVVSDGVKQELVGQGISPEKILVIPTAVKLENFAHASLTRVSEIKEKYKDKKILLYVGRLESVKNLPMLLASMKSVLAKVPNTVLLIAGQGSLEENLKAQVKQQELEGNVFFLGNIKHSDLPNYYGACDLFVLPSDSESLGKVLIEAGMSGRAVVSTKTTGAGSVVAHRKTGLLTATGNQASFTSAIVKLLLDDNLRKTLGTAAPDHLRQKFERGTGIEKWMQFWQQIANKIKRI